jgi:hypothetical protein
MPWHPVYQSQSRSIPADGALSAGLVSYFHTVGDAYPLDDTRGRPYPVSDVVHSKAGPEAQETLVMQSLQIMETSVLMPLSMSSARYCPVNQYLVLGRCSLITPTPYSRIPSITSCAMSSSLNPSICLRVCSLCSPSRGARLTSVMASDMAKAGPTARYSPTSGWSITL